MEHQNRCLSAECDVVVVSAVVVVAADGDDDDDDLAVLLRYLEAHCVRSDVMPELLHSFAVAAAVVGDDSSSSALYLK